MGDKLIIHTEEMRDKVRVPAMYSLILVRSFFLSYITNVPLRLSVPLFFFLLTCQANESDPRDLQLQGPSNPIKAFQIKLNTYLFP